MKLKQAEPAKLVPALHTLACEGLLPAATRVIGVARSDLSDEEFQARSFEEFDSIMKSLRENFPGMIDDYEFVISSPQDCTRL